jgi:hypothetical protein
MSCLPCLCLVEDSEVVSKQNEKGPPALATYILQVFAQYKRRNSQIQYIKIYAQYSFLALIVYASRIVKYLLYRFKMLCINFSR